MQIKKLPFLFRWILLWPLAIIIHPSYVLYRSFDARSWQPTKAHVVNSWIDKKVVSVSDEVGSSGLTVFYPCISYKYLVNGKEYQGNRIAFIQVEEKYLFEIGSSCQIFLSEHQQGSEITIYVSPKDPSKSVIIREPFRHIYQQIFAVLGLGAFLLWFRILYSIRAPRAMLLE